jgi:hypothetical protein
MFIIKYIYKPHLAPDGVDSKRSVCADFGAFAQFLVNGR